MASVIGALRVTLGIDTAAFQEGLSLAQKQLSTAGKRLQGIGKNIAGVGAVLSAGITAPFTALVGAAIPAALESRDALAQVEAALKSMGGASGKTAEDLKKAARELQALSTFDDDEILRKVTANLLTFGNVSGAAFDRAQLAAVNLSARLGQDLQSSAIQLGKALNDPIAGITALSRVGVSFTADQKEMIRKMAEAGDVAGAQNIILSELERQYGGAAKAARDAAPDQDTIVAWRNFQETIGDIALKVLPPLTGLMTRLLDLFNNLSPEMQTFAVGAAAVAAAVGPVAVGIGGITMAIGALMPLLAALVVAVGALGAPFIAVAAAIAGLALALNYFNDDIAVFETAYRAWIERTKAMITGWIDTTAAAFNRGVEAARALYTGVKTWIGDRLNAVWEGAKQKIKAVGDAFRDLWDRVVGHSYIPDMVTAIGLHMSKLDKNMVQQALDATGETADAFGGLARSVDASFANIARTIAHGDWKSALAQGLSLLGQTVPSLSGFTDIAGSILGGISGFAQGGRPHLGMPAIVGEKGPELFVPDTAGRVISNKDLSGGGGAPSISLTINAPGATAETVMMVRREMAAAVPAMLQMAQGSTLRAASRPALAGGIR